MDADPLKPFRDTFGWARQDDIDSLERVAGYVALFYNTLVTQGVPDSIAAALTNTWMLGTLDQAKNAGNK